MGHRILSLSCFVVLFLVTGSAWGQTADTVFFLANKKGLLGKLGKSVSVNAQPFPYTELGATVKNADDFSAFEGKTIRKIMVQKLGFAVALNDSLKEKKSFLSSLGDQLHVKTREWVIRKNLFFEEGDLLSPNVMADNAKLIRDLSFLQDARIVVLPIPNDPQAVDVVVFCKDVFPLGGSISEVNPEMVRFEINHDNLAGTGDRLQYSSLFDTRRSPAYGYGIEGVKRNLLGSFINLAGGFTTANPTFNAGRREEHSFYLQASLPLVSPYRLLTGALTIARSRTENLYGDDVLYDSLYRYAYNVVDGWVGFNLHAKQTQNADQYKERGKAFLSGRGFARNFYNVPSVLRTQYDSRFTDLNGFLVAFTRFKQDYYHTNFILGFGRNEDIPVGRRFAVTAGWTSRENTQRPYLGVEFQKQFFTEHKGYLNFYTSAGGFWYQNSGQDMVLLGGISYFTGLKKLPSPGWYLRHFLDVSGTYLYNPKFNDPLRLSSDWGIPFFSNTNYFPTMRGSVKAESVFYQTFSLAGFRFAPFGFGHFTYLKQLGTSPLQGDVFSALGLGVRTRNENLVFGTMELRVTYYPRVLDNMRNWNIRFTTDLRFRFQSQFLAAPDFVRYN